MKHANLQSNPRVVAQAYGGLVGRDNNFRLVPRAMRKNGDAVFSPDSIPHVFRFKLD